MPWMLALQESQSRDDTVWSKCPTGRITSESFKSNRRTRVDQKKFIEVQSIFFLQHVSSWLPAAVDPSHDKQMTVSLRLMLAIFTNFCPDWMIKTFARARVQSSLLGNHYSLSQVVCIFHAYPARALMCAVK